MIHDLTFLDGVEELDPPRCCSCKAEKPDQVGLSLIETDELEAEDFGFCSVPCLVTFVQDRYLARALAAPSSPGGPPPAVGGGTGTAREPVGSGKSPVAPGRSTSSAVTYG